jgi:hypothetical protein
MPLTKSTYRWPGYGMQNTAFGQASTAKPTFFSTALTESLLNGKRPLSLGNSRKALVASLS